MAAKRSIKTNIITATERDELLAEYADLEEQVAKPLDRMAEIEDLFRELPQDIYHSENGEVQVYANTRFDPAQAMARLSDRSLRRVMVLKMDAALVKRFFPRVYRESRNTFDNRVSIRPDVKPRLSIVE